MPDMTMVDFGATLVDSTVPMATDSPLLLLLMMLLRRRAVGSPLQIGRRYPLASDGVRVVVITMMKCVLTSVGGIVIIRYVNMSTTPLGLRATFHNMQPQDVQNNTALRHLDASLALQSSHDPLPGRTYLLQLRQHLPTPIARV